MKHTRKLALAAAMAVGLASHGAFVAPAAAAPKKPAAAAKAPAPQQNPLGLSKAQMAKMNAIQAKAQKDASAVRAGKGTEEQKRQKLIAIAKRADAEAGAVLTPAQKKKIDQQRTAQMAAMKKMQANNEAVMKSLTPAQKKKIEALRADFQKKQNAIMANKGLSNEQKQQKFMALVRDMDKSMNTILTAKQRSMLHR